MTTVVLRSPVYAKSKDCGEFLCYHQLLITPIQTLEKPYSLVDDNVQLRTDSIDFLAALISFDHHELFYLQQSHNGNVKFSCVCKIEVVWRA